MKTKITNKTLYLLLALTIFFSALTGLFANLSFKSVHAQTEVSITNNNFDSDTVSSSSPLKKPTGWTVEQSNELVTSGVISLDSTIFDAKKEESYKLSFKPTAYLSRKDDQVLMINSQDSLVNFGYKSSSFTLSKNSYYKLTFKANTENSDTRTAFATANLLGNDILENNVLNILTEGSWADFTILIATDNISDVTANLQFWLGSKNGTKSYGAVFFDEVNLYSIDKSSFENLSSHLASNSNAKIINLQSTISSSQFENNSFENNTLTDWEALTNNGSSLGNANNYAGLIRFPDSDYESTYKLSQDLSNLGSKSKALLINNNDSASIGFRSSKITLKQFGTYKISILVNAQVTGSATANLIEVKSSSVSSPKSFSAEISSTSTSGWTEYAFYIQARSFTDTEVYLELWLGESEKSTGYVIFDDIIVYNITSNEYATGIENSNSTEANFAPSSSLSVPNGMFNLIENDSREQNPPYSAKNWTLTGANSTNSLCGIINTKDTSMFPDFFNPSTGENNNILMIGSRGATSLTYTTENSIELEAKKYYKLTFKVQTQSLTESDKVSVKLYTDDFTIYEFSDISSDQEWITYTLYIHTGIQSLDAKIALNLTGNGFAFFDDISLISSSETSFNKTLDENSFRVDIENDQFTNVSSRKNGIYTSNTFAEETSNSLVQSGVIDINHFDSFFSGVSNPELPQNVNGNLLMISSRDDVNYAMLSKQIFSLTSGTYYEISVWVKTTNLNQDENNKVLIGDSKDEYYPMGATISLTEINKTFSEINTNGEWKQYFFYINSTDSASIQIKLSLGNSNALTRGTVYFTNVLVKEIESDTYYDNVAPLENDATINNIMAVGSTKIEKTDDTDNSDDGSVNFDWLIIPTLISAVALIIAIVGVAIRKFAKKHPRPVKIKTGEYNRELSLEKDFAHLEEIKKQQQKIEELKLELEKVKSEMSASKIEFKQEEKQHKLKVEQKIKIQKQKTKNISKTNKDKQEIKALKEQSRAEIKAIREQEHKLFKEQRYAEYLAKQAELKKRFDMIEAEIEAIYQEELRLIKLYKEYRKQVALKKKELKLQKKLDKKQ